MDEIFRVDLAKFASAPIYCELGRRIRARHVIASADCVAEKVMSGIRDVDLAMFCGQVGNLYGRYGLCPPLTLRDAAQGWIARDIRSRIALT